MKKEELKVNTYDKEKGIKKFRIFEKIVLFVEIIAIVSAILVGVASIGIGASIMLDATEEAEIETVNQTYIEETDEAELDPIDVAFKVLTVIFGIMLLDTLRKLFKETADQGTPFTEKTVQLVKNISTFSFLCFVFSVEHSFGTYIISYLLLICVIFSIEHIFRYGYELQKESDETI